MDLVKATKVSKVAVKKSDLDSVQFNFQILNDGLVADLTDATVQLAIKKPSLLTVFEDCTITNATNGECEVILSNQSYLEVGTHIGELYVTQNAELAISNSFEYSSLDAILTDLSLQSTNDWQAIHDILLQSESRPLLGENSPNGVVPSAYKGQFFFDTLNNAIYFSTLEAVNDSWLPLGGGEGVGGVVQWKDVLLKPTSFPPSAHEHAMTEITGLTSALNAKLEAIPAEYLTESEADAKYGLIGEGGGGTVDWTTGVTGKPATFAPSAHTHTKANITDFTHTHAIADVTNLSTTLTGKSDTGHTHAYSSLTAIPTTFAPTAHTHVKANITDFAHNHPISDVTGLTTALDGKADDADLTGKANITDVYNKTETYNKTEVDTIVTGITEGGGTIVENNLTSVSTTNALSANQGRILDIALDGKSDTNHTHAYASLTAIPATFAPSAHTHTKANITDFAHVHPMSEITGLTGALDGKADDADLTTKANVADVYTKLQTYSKGEVDTIVTGITEGGGTIVEDNLVSNSPTNALSANQGRALNVALGGKSDAGHTHAYASLTAIPATFTPTAHTHVKANITDFAHNHPISEITGLTSALDGKADDADLTGKSDIGHTHTYASLTAIPATFTPTAHTHDWTTGVTGKPTTFTPAIHQHAISDVTNLQTTLDGKADDADLTGKANSTDVYLKTETYSKTEVNTSLTGKSDAGHTHAYASLTAIPATFTPSTHSHAIADVTNLQTTLNGKSDTNHTHTYASLTSIPTTFTPATHTHTEADLTFGAKNAKTYVDDADNFILGTTLGGLKFVQLNQSAYDALGTKDASTIYFISG